MDPAAKHLARLKRKLAAYEEPVTVAPSDQDYASLYHVIFRTHKLNKGRAEKLVALGWIDKHGKLTEAGRAERGKAMALMKSGNKQWSK